jgi:hypothetical protein
LMVNHGWRLGARSVHGRRKTIFTFKEEIAIWEYIRMNSMIPGNDCTNEMLYDVAAQGYIEKLQREDGRLQQSSSSESRKYYADRFWKCHSRFTPVIRTIWTISKPLRWIPIHYSLYQLSREQSEAARFAINLCCADHRIERCTQ